FPATFAPLTAAATFAAFVAVPTRPLPTVPAASVTAPAPCATPLPTAPATSATAPPTTPTVPAAASAASPTAAAAPRAALPAIHGTDGRPPVSSAAISSPPRM